MYYEIFYVNSIEKLSVSWYNNLIHKTLKVVDIMKLFISYKSEDFSAVSKIIEIFREISPEIQVSYLRNSKHWRRLAKKYIAKSDLVIYLAGHEYSENIDWEINTAIQKGYKVYCVKLSDDVVLDERLFTVNKFDTSIKNPKVIVYNSLSELISLIRGNSDYLHNKLFENNIKDDVSLIEQYKVMISTSESLIERRQKLTTTYLSIFSALLPVISTMLSFTYFYLYLGASLISIICIILCFSWRSTIISYGKSNRAKFAILEEIESKLPATMFSSEWLALKKITTKYKSFTDRETIIPILFVVVYAVLLIISIVLIVLNFIHK